MNNSKSSSKLWLALGALFVLGVTVVVLRETPAMRREWKLIRM